MIYIGIECTKCGVVVRSNTCEGKTNFTRWMRKDGWQIGRDGTTLCPKCKSKRNAHETEKHAR